MKGLARGLQAATLITLTAVVAAGCGGEDEEPATAAAEQTLAKQIELSIETDQFAVTRGDIADLEGTVTPPDANVEVEGLTAEVDGGTWAARVKLDRVGENEVEVIASAAGREEASATTVLVREQTKAEQTAERRREARAAAAAKAREERAAARREARRKRAAERAAAREAAQQTTVPSVVGERLDVARAHLRDAGLRTRALGGGTFGIIVESNWTVCATEPGSGAPAEKGDRIRVIVDRVC